MKEINVDKLKIGDWILDEGIGLKGKFRVARIKGYNVDGWQEIDLKKGKITTLGKSGGGKGIILEKIEYIRVLDKKEVEKLGILKNKFSILRNLEDEEDGRGI